MLRRKLLSMCLLKVETCTIWPAPREAGSKAQEQETKTLNQVQNLVSQADDPQYTIRTVPFEKVNDAMSLLEGGHNVGCWRTVLKWG
jgi:hypothetical protein